MTTIEYHPDPAINAEIAVPGSLYGTEAVMACHEHPVGQEAHCIGWLVNQIGPGNNIALRLKMLSCENAGKIVVDGEQHVKFEDTLPEAKKCPNW